MPNIFLDLTVDRVDLVPEGANTASFIQLYKARKEIYKGMDLQEILGKLAPDTAAVVKDAVEKAISDATKETADKLADTDEKLKKATDDLTEACAKAAGFEASMKETQAKLEEVVQKSKPAEISMEEVIKGLDPKIAEFVTSLQSKVTAAEEVAKAAEASKRHEVAVSKAAELKALPIPQEELVGLVEKSAPEMVDTLSKLAVAFEKAALGEVGKNTPGQEGNSEAWGRIEQKAAVIAKERNISKEKAIAAVAKENPELYREYLGEVK